MNYGYLFVRNYKDLKCSNCFEQIKKSIQSIKDFDPAHEDIIIFADSIDNDLQEYARNNNITLQQITVSREYNGSAIASVLVEKIIALLNYDQNKEIVFLDLDTTFTDTPDWNLETAYLWEPEYPLLSARNLDTVLPFIPWQEIGIEFDETFSMKNTGVIFIPKEDRKEVCSKALWIADYLNNGMYKPEDRSCNKLDEQIGLSIVLEQYYGKQGKLQFASSFVYHYWAENMDGIKWW